MMDECSSECDLFEANMTGIYDDPAELLARAAGRVATLARYYGSHLAEKRRRASDAQLRRLDQLEQCAQFFWMCCETIEHEPHRAVQLLDRATLPRWEGPQSGTRSLFRICQGQPYCSVVGSCLDTLLQLATDRFMPEVFSVADLQCLLKVSLRFPQPTIRCVSSTGETLHVISDGTPERIRQLIQSRTDAEPARGDAAQ